ncbi:uncharacterized protein LY89DRAFT_716405 [Mollisia scopiformis]|uniref:Pre-rRNA-processing protein RIX1 n=1 Tax=Mollisia scopiformis TaxID=149040 RepID=A0A194XJI8_MOLSC|nr:uncharacterized protein LY89DRAFT_716405 [Mollisia scopiformis]KUJ19927.1 hypothetical protein LY89DRAFT_716405 [Mollisia scopiformis]
MSLPPELRVLCFLLSSTAVSDLPRLTPTLLSYVLRCQVPLSMPAVATGKAEASSSAVLVHKLKTQLSTLLNGKSTEGRFTAVVLIKAVVEIGGWEILNASESWVRGLLSILGKPDAVSTKELAIVTLSKLYTMTHQYQTLIREITTPTLPAFVTACLALVSPKSTTKSAMLPSSLEETIFEAFSMLVPRHTSIFRPFATQIHTVVRRYIASTISDGLFVPSSVKESARRLYVVLHQTAAKNMGGEDWANALRELIKETHVTADQVFRAVIEDWESSAGYGGPSVDVNKELRGGGDTSEELPPWNGIFAGIERLTGLLEMLAMYLTEETSAPVALPLGSIVDVLNRMLSIAIPTSSSLSTRASARLHPAIDRDERDVLCASLPRVYIAAFQLVNKVAKRLGGSFLSVAQAVFDQLAWVFPFGKHDQQFRTVAYEITVDVLMHIGPSLTRSQVGKCYDILRSCCKDLEVLSPSLVNNATSLSQKSHASRTHNADTFLQISTVAQTSPAQSTDLTLSARKLLSTSLSHLPQQYVDISIRILIERTAILSHNKDAMLASVLNPFVGKNGKPMASILPHLTREFGYDATVEILLRPRMPLLPSTPTRPPVNDAVDEEPNDEDEDMLPPVDAPSTHQDLDGKATTRVVAPLGDSNPPNGPSALTTASLPRDAPSAFAFAEPTTPALNSIITKSSSSFVRTSQEAIADVDMVGAGTAGSPNLGILGAEGEESSSDESVHLTMQLDTDSEDDDI